MILLSKLSDAKQSELHMEDKEMSPKKQKLLKILLIVATVNAVAIIILVIIKIWMMLNEHTKHGIDSINGNGETVLWLLLGIVLFLLYDSIKKKPKKEDNENLQ